MVPWCPFSFSSIGNLLSSSLQEFLGHRSQAPEQCSPHQFHLRWNPGGAVWCWPFTRHQGLMSQGDAELHLKGWGCFWEQSSWICAEVCVSSAVNWEKFDVRSLLYPGVTLQHHPWRPGFSSARCLRTTKCLCQLRLEVLSSWVWSWANLVDPLCTWRFNAFRLWVIQQFQRTTRLQRETHQALKNPSLECFVPPMTSQKVSVVMAGVKEATRCLSPQARSSSRRHSSHGVPPTRPTSQAIKRLVRQRRRNGRCTVTVLLTLTEEKTWKTFPVLVVREELHFHSSLMERIYGPKSEIWVEKNDQIFGARFFLESLCLDFWSYLRIAVRSSIGHLLQLGTTRARWSFHRSLVEKRSWPTLRLGVHESPKAVVLSLLWPRPFDTSFWSSLCGTLAGAGGGRSSSCGLWNAVDVNFRTQSEDVLIGGSEISLAWATVMNSQLE